MDNLFDNEYGFDELIPVSILESWAEGVRRLNVSYFEVVLADGVSYFRSNGKGPSERSYGARIVKAGRREAPFQVNSPEGGLQVTPVMDELAPIAYLITGFHDSAGKTDSLFPVGSLFACSMKHLITESKKNLMTSRLHGQVVEESFFALKQKAALLAASEKKYRTLAQNLEKEVASKTRKIEETKVRFMQQEKMAAIGQLAAGVAHEINNPMGFITSNLNSLVCYLKEMSTLITLYNNITDNREYTSSGIPETVRSEIMKFREESDMEFVLEDIPGLLEESIEGANRIKNIVCDLKDFAHPGEDKRAFSDINENIEKTLNIVRNELKYKITLVKDYEQLPPVEINAGQINQVFMNLFVNASHAIEEKGEIRISTRALGESVEIRVKDTGAGISKEHVRKIFDPFFTTKPVGKGTGLGLNLVYNIIRNHNGSISVNSEPGSGTEFIIQLPVSNESDTRQQMGDH